MITDPEYLQKLQAWQEAVDALKAATSRENMLRQDLFSTAFPQPKEGANTTDLPNGWKLKGTYRINIKLDEAAVPSIKDDLVKLGTNPDLIFKSKLSLDARAYNKLPSASKAVVENILTFTPGMPGLELVPPKE